MSAYKIICTQLCLMCDNSMLFTLHAENSTTEEVVELHTCSSTILQCGSLLPALGLRPALEWTWDGTSLNGSSDVCIEVM